MSGLLFRYHFQWNGTRSLDFHAHIAGERGGSCSWSVGHRLLYAPTVIVAFHPLTGLEARVHFNLSAEEPSAQCSSVLFRCKALNECVSFSSVVVTFGPIYVRRGTILDEISRHRHLGCEPLYLSEMTSRSSRSPEPSQLPWTLPVTTTLVAALQ